jgi:hypothetical protein
MEMFRYYYDFQKVAILERLGKISILSYAMVSVYTIIMLFRDPALLRLSARQGIFVRSLGVGGYGSLYGSIFIIIGMTYIIGSSQYRFSSRLQSIFLMAIFCLQLWLGKFTIAYLLTLLGIGIMIIMNFNKKRKWLVLIPIGIGFILVLFATRPGIFVQNISNRISDNSVSERVSDLSSLLSGDASGRILSNRAEIYLGDIRTFLRYPYIGTLPTRIMGRRVMDESSGHSSIFTLLAEFGILFSLCFAQYMVSIYHKAILIWRKDKYRNIIMLIGLLYIILSSINSTFNAHQITFVIYMITPILPKIFKKRAAGIQAY